MRARAGSRVALAAILTFVGCRRLPASDRAEAGAEGHAPPSSLAPPPASRAGPFRAGDPVIVVRPDGTVEPSAEVKAVGAAVVLIETGGFPAEQWIPTSEASQQHVKARAEGTSYRVTIRRVRGSSELWFPAARVFDVPWKSALRMKPGDSVVERRYGNFPRRRCVVESAPSRDAITATCDGRSTRIELADAFSAIEPAKLESIVVADFVYVDKMDFALVLAKDGASVTVRRTGWGRRDERITDLARFERVR